MNDRSSRGGNTISNIFLQGVAITVPVSLTVALLYWAAAGVESFLGTLIQYLFPGLSYWTGMGIALAIALIFLTGILMNAWITRRLVGYIDRLLARIPIFKSVYISFRDIARFLFRKNARSGFRQVVAVSVTEQIRLLGFVTVELGEESPLASDANDPLVGVYLPMSYQIGGYTAYLPRSLIEPIDMTVEDAMRFTLTAGMSGLRSIAAKRHLPRRGKTA